MIVCWQNAKNMICPILSKDHAVRCAGPGFFDKPGCMAWRWFDPVWTSNEDRRGFCGLAGKPERDDEAEVGGMLAKPLQSLVEEDGSLVEGI